ncbi:OmpA family protein [Flavobacterium collinsii]|uniref:OmpA-like domain-containing protein n=1 Tax=Flavobacterium collinsii TaxID=1114861 RepID=A0A9W4TGT0_9FLAO|nr:hypothetical protein [Flavobacterium collinsii]CAI2767895.1 protein of unknown function [Flavobacterium collinsii]
MQHKVRDICTAHLIKEYFAELGNVSIANNPDWKSDTDISINGGRGTVRDLQLLRAKVIKQFLIKRGINPNRISIGAGVLGKDTKSASAESR